MIHGYSSAMSNLPVDEDRLKEVLKVAIAEVLEERRDLVVGLLEEALEDVGLLRAMEEAEGSPYVSRDEVMRILAD
jgi:hypothetical protein